MRRVALVASLVGFILWGLGFSVASAQSAAGESGKETGNEKQSEVTEYYLQRLANHRLEVGDPRDRRVELVPQPLMRFSNPVSQIQDGLAFLWTVDGRPMAMVKSYFMRRTHLWGRTFTSLSPEPIVLRIGKEQVWTPERTIPAKEVPDAPQPAANARRRLAQMRDIAKRFEIVDNWGLHNPTDWQLRVLPTPLYRYESPEQKVIDGALFGYILTTSPEALLLIEAVEGTDGPTYRYTLARFTRFKLTVRLDGESLQEFPRLDKWPASGEYFHIPQPIPNYPFLPTESP